MTRERKWRHREEESEDKGRGEYNGRRDGITKEEEKE